MPHAGRYGINMGDLTNVPEVPVLDCLLLPPAGADCSPRRGGRTKYLLIP